MRRRERVPLLAIAAITAQLTAAAAQVVGGLPEAGGTDPRLLRPLTMADCLDIALQNNIDLRVARLDEAAVRTTISEAKGAFWPVLGVNYEHTRKRLFGEFPDKTEHFDNGFVQLTQLLPSGTTLLAERGALHYRLDPDVSDTPARQWVFGITQPLLRGGWFRTTLSGVRGAGYDTRISQANLDGTRLGVVQQVKTAYFEVIRAAKQVEIADKGIERDQQLVLQSRSKLEAGLGTKRDVLSAEIQLDQDRGKLVDAQTAWREALDGLARVLGLQVETHRLEIAEQEVSIDTLLILESEWLARAMQNNPTVRAAQLTVERTRLDMQVAGNERLPQLDLSFIYNSLDDRDVNELTKEENRLRILVGKEPKVLDFTASEGWSTFLTFSYPLGNRSLGAAYKRARLVHQQAQRSLEDTRRQVALDVRTAIRVLRNNLEQVEILQKSIEGAQNKLEFASVNFQLGRASNLDITDAQKDLLNAQTDYVNAIIDYRIELARLEALIGGFD